MKKSDFLYGIALLSVIPVRREPREQSEMVTQLLFGDTFTIIEREKNWLHIKINYDNYEGWISKNVACQIEESVYNEITQQETAVVSSLQASVFEGDSVIPILAGSVLPNYDSATKIFKIGKRMFSFRGTCIDNIVKNKESIVDFAKMYLNAPYLWGGKTPYGIDCSGFVQQVGKFLGVRLPRDASQQIAVGEDIGFLENTQIGDLAFFDDEEGKIIHVGILIDKDKIIHASGKVRIDDIDQQGIYNRELKQYTHNLRVIRRII